ncbi:MAG: tRNA (adenosine(37)-N6)-dimethylallyltransferase MiaA, partial [Candidatus Dadabacteria bacterium]
MASKEQKKLLVISGPTASGKSKLAFYLAKKLNSEIVSADSVAVYKEFNIGTDKPSKSQLEEVPHHLINVLTPKEKCTVSFFCKEALKILDSLCLNHKIPILSGGTTLYISSLINGLTHLPTNKELRKELESTDTKELYQRLTKIAPKTAVSLHPNDKVRIVRALEVALLTKKEPKDILKEGEKEKFSGAVLILVLFWRRDELHQRIKARTVGMIEKGLINEVEEIVLKWGESLHPLNSVGYREVLQFLRGKIKSKEELIEKISAATRRLARHQMIFWRNEPKKRDYKIIPLQNDSSYPLIGCEAGEDRLKRKREGVRVLSLNKESLLKYLKDALENLESDSKVV